MEIVDFVPETPDKGFCEKHGEFDYQYVKIFSGKFMVRSCCGECVSEEKRAEAIEEKRKADEIKAVRLAAHKSSIGVAKRNHSVKFPDFVADTDQKKKTKDRIEQWLKLFRDDKNKAPSVIITGKVGTGKTMIASCIINELINDVHNHPSCMIIKLIDMVRRLKETWRRDSEKTERQLIDTYSGLDLLIIDEVGMGFESDTEKLFIFDIIDGRYQNQLPTILISNLNIEGIKQSIGDRAIDRLRDGGGFAIGCDWESYRK